MYIWGITVVVVVGVIVVCKVKKEHKKVKQEEDLYYAYLDSLERKPNDSGGDGGD